jgi:hypothetical protein
MEKMSDDILRIIIAFLSPEEKIKIREVSKGFKTLVSQRKLNEYRLKKLMKRFVWREDKLEEELNLMCRHIYHKKTNKLHPYFSRSGTRREDHCIVERCYNPQLSYTYIKDRKIARTWQGTGGYVWACSKRKIPYCVHCFEIWMIRCSIAELNLSSGWPDGL